MTGQETSQGKIPDLNFPLKCYRAFQWKYELDKGSSWWRRAYFRFIYLPFAKFSYFKVKIIPFERLEPDGSLSWKEDQGVFLNKEDAKRESSRHPFGGYTTILLNAPEPRGTIIGRTHFPYSESAQEYEDSITKEKKEAHLKVHEALNEAQKVIDLFRSTRA